MVLVWIVPVQIIAFEESVQQKFLSLYVSIAETFVHWHYGKYSNSMTMDEATCVVLSDLIDMFFGNPSIKKIIQITDNYSADQLATVIGITRSCESYFDWGVRKKYGKRPFPCLMGFTQLSCALYRRHELYTNTTLGNCCINFIDQPRFHGNVCLFVLCMFICFVFVQGFLINKYIIE